MGPPLSPRQGIPITVNSTVNTSPFFPSGKSPGARCTAPTDESGKVLASNRAASSASRLYQRQIVFFAGLPMSLLHRDELLDAGKLLSLLPFDFLAQLFVVGAHLWRRRLAEIFELIERTNLDLGFLARHRVR